MREIEVDIESIRLFEEKWVSQYSNLFIERLNISPQASEHVTQGRLAQLVLARRNYKSEYELKAALGEIGPYFFGIVNNFGEANGKAFIERRIMNRNPETLIQEANSFREFEIGDIRYSADYNY